MRGWMTCGLMLLLLGGMLPSQETGRSLITAARKRAADARGKKGAERDEVLKDAVRILAMVPERFPGESPAVARSWLEQGRLRRRMGEPEKAIAALLKVLEHPKEPSPVCKALHDLASFYRRSKQAEKAAQALVRIVSEYPTQARSRAQALIRLGGLERSARRYDQAAAHLDRCLKEHADLWRQSVDALNARVSLELVQDRPAAARKILAAQEEAIRTRFAGGPHDEQVVDALTNMTSRARLQKIEKAEPSKGGKGR